MLNIIFCCFTTVAYFIVEMWCFLSRMIYFMFIFEVFSSWGWRHVCEMLLSDISTWKHWLNKLGQVRCWSVIVRLVGGVLGLRTIAQRNISYWFCRFHKLWIGVWTLPWEGSWWEKAAVPIFFHRVRLVICLTSHQRSAHVLPFQGFVSMTIFCVGLSWSGRTWQFQYGCRGSWLWRTVPTAAKRGEVFRIKKQSQRSRSSRLLFVSSC